VGSAGRSCRTLAGGGRIDRADGVGAFRRRAGCRARRPRLSRRDRARRVGRAAHLRQDRCRCRLRGGAGARRGRFLHPAGRRRDDPRPLRRDPRRGRRDVRLRPRAARCARHRRAPVSQARAAHPRCARRLRQRTQRLCRRAPGGGETGQPVPGRRRGYRHRVRAAPAVLLRPQRYCRPAGRRQDAAARPGPLAEGPAARTRGGGDRRLQRLRHRARPVGRRRHPPRLEQPPAVLGRGRVV
jgi:hypothetical protein